jgi:hypothetical protein
VAVRVYPPLRPSIVATPISGGRWRLSGQASGGDGHQLAWQWQLPDGTRANGPNVTYKGDPAGTTLTVADGTTMTASVSR